MCTLFSVETPRKAGLSSERCVSLRMRQVETWVVRANGKNNERQRSHVVDGRHLQDKRNRAVVDDVRNDAGIGIVTATLVDKQRLGKPRSSRAITRTCTRRTRQQRQTPSGWARVKHLVGETQNTTNHKQNQLRRLRNIMVKTTTTRNTFVENQIWMSPFSAVSLTVSSRCFHIFG